MVKKWVEFVIFNWYFLYFSVFNVQITLITYYGILLVCLSVGQIHTLGATSNQYVPLKSLKFTFYVLSKKLILLYWIADSSELWHRYLSPLQSAAGAQNSVSHRSYYSAHPSWMCSNRRIVRVVEFFQIVHLPRERMIQKSLY